MFSRASNEMKSYYIMKVCHIIVRPEIAIRCWLHDAIGLHAIIFRLSLVDAHGKFHLHTPSIIGAAFSPISIIINKRKVARLAHVMALANRFVMPIGYRHRLSKKSMMASEHNVPARWQPVTCPILSAYGWLINLRRIFLSGKRQRYWLISRLSHAGSLIHTRYYY